MTALPLPAASAPSEELNPRSSTLAARTASRQCGSCPRSPRRWRTVPADDGYEGERPLVGGAQVRDVGVDASHDWCRGAVDAGRLLGRAAHGSEPFRSRVVRRWRTSPNSVRSWTVWAWTRTCGVPVRAAVVSGGSSGPPRGDQGGVQWSGSQGTRARYWTEPKRSKRSSSAVVFVDQPTQHVDPLPRRFDGADSTSVSWEA